MSEPVASWRRAAAFVFLELVVLFAAAAILRAGGPGIGIPITMFGPPSTSS